MKDVKLGILIKLECRESPASLSVTASCRHEACYFQLVNLSNLPRIVILCAKPASKQIEHFLVWSGLVIGNKA